jgi:ABC-type multidrug transport system ATPase subunit
MTDRALILAARRLRAARGVVVARDVSLTASPGEVVAVEGPNGSGKTTLLAAAAGLLPAGSASVRPGSVGYAPERAGVLPRIALHRWLTGLARTSGLTRDEAARRAADAAAEDEHASRDGLCRRADGVAVPSRRGPGGGGRAAGRYAPVLTQV